jgi:hypothetical protein
VLLSAFHLLPDSKPPFRLQRSFHNLAHAAVSEQHHGASNQLFMAYQIVLVNHWDDIWPPINIVVKRGNFKKHEHPAGRRMNTGDFINKNIGYQQCKFQIWRECCLARIL